MVPLLGCAPPPALGELLDWPPLEEGWFEVEEPLEELKVVDEWIREKWKERGRLTVGAG